MLTTLESHDPVKPFFLYLPWQAVHSPYDDVPGWVEGPGRSTYQGMLWATDVYAGKIRTLLEAKGMWENMLVVYSSDNGGRGSGINYPLRGEKRTNYDGGMRVTAFVSGGLIPQALRGTSNDIRFHIVDWYPTFCRLVGISSFDGSPTPPEPVDPTNPDKVRLAVHGAPVAAVCDYHHHLRRVRFSSKKSLFLSFFPPSALTYECLVLMENLNTTFATPHKGHLRQQYLA